MNKAKKEALTKLKAPFDVIKRLEKPLFGRRKEHSRRKHREDFGMNALTNDNNQLKFI